FDISTGEVSNFISWSQMSPYGAGFSPNSEVLYTNNGTIYQYDLTDFPDEDAVEDSEYMVSWVSLSTFRLATNGILYTGTTAVNEPNLLGAACDAEAGAITLSFGTF